MHRSTYKTGSAYQRHPDVACSQIQDRGQGALRDNDASHHDANLAPARVLSAVQGEPVAAVANVLDVPKSRYEDIRHLMRVDKQPRLLQFYKHDALPTRARVNAERPSHDGAITFTDLHRWDASHRYQVVNA